MKKKSVLCVIASKGLMDHIYPFYFAHVFLCMNEMSSLINHVRLGTVIAYMCGNVLRKLASFWSKSQKNVNILGTSVDPFTPYKFQIIQNIFLYVYTIEMH